MVLGPQLTLIQEGFKYLPVEIRDNIYRRYVAFWQYSDIMPRLLELFNSRNHLP